MPSSPDPDVPRFAVVVPTYNRPQMLAEALDSVLGQTVSDFECIVVDDAGPLEATIPDDPRFRLLRQPVNRGVAAAVNTGVAAARATYVTILNDDDWLHPERLALAAEALERAPIGLCWFRYADEPAREGRRLDGNVHDVVLDSIAPSMGAMAIAREHWQPVDESYRACEDLEWWLRVTEKLDVATVPQLGYLVRRHDGIRHENGPRARIEFSYRLMHDHTDYFASHRAARAFRLFRIGLTARSIGDRREARRALARSFLARPSPRTAAHLARAFLPPR